MRSLVLFWLLGTVFIVFGQNENGQTKELQTRLRRSIVENRKLKQQMDRMQLVWTGLGQMCQTLNQPLCDCKDTTGMESDEEAPLRIISVKSSNQSDTVHLIVTYTAREDHIISWLLVYSNYGSGGFYKTGGEKTSLDSQTFSSSIALTDQKLVQYIEVRVYAGTENALVRFDLYKLKGEHEHIVPEYGNIILSLNKAYTAPKHGDMNISIALRGALEEWSLTRQSAHVSYTGMNVSSNPPEFFNANIDTSDLITIAGYQRTSNTSTLVITLREPLIQSGGILDILLPHTIMHESNNEGDFVETLRQGHIVDIVPADSFAIVPKNTVGLIPVENITLVSTVSSLWCNAMGNPTPDVQIYRVTKDGKRKKVGKVEIQIYNNYTKVALHTLRADDKKTPGLYVCRAQSGTAVAEEYVSVTVYKPARFDEAKTAVIKNNTNKVVYGCKATGMPRPELEFRLYENIGPVIQQNDQYQVSEIHTGKRTSRILLTVSPPDENLHTVFCVTRAIPMEYRKIELFPGEERGWDWDMYNEMMGPYVNYTIPFY